MRSRLSSSLAVLIVALTTLTGCSDSGNPAGPESALSENEAISIFGEILSAVLTLGFDPDPEVASEGAAFTTIEVTVDETIPCEGGGSIRLSGTLSAEIDDDGNGNFAYQIVETPAACGVTTDSGRSYTVNGNPSIEMTGSYEFADGVPIGSFGMTFSGGLGWSATDGSGSGSCGIDLVYTLNLQTASGSVQGTLCGFTIDESFSGALESRVIALR